MKKRKGFVSNSSSSSFCILGYRFDNFWNENDEIIYDFYTDKYGYGYIPIIFKDEDDIIHFLGDSYECCGGISDFTKDTCFIGIDPNNLDENKSIYEHKLKIKKDFRNKLKMNISIDDIKFYTDGGDNR